MLSAKEDRREDEAEEAVGLYCASRGVADGCGVSCGSMGWLVNAEAEADGRMDEDADEEAFGGICKEASWSCPATEWAIGLAESPSQLRSDLAAVVSVESAELSQCEQGVWKRLLLSCKLQRAKDAKTPRNQRQWMWSQIKDLAVRLQRGCWTGAEVKRFRLCFVAFM